MVLVLLPLACFERATIGFRLQKLEIHFNASYPGPDARTGRLMPLSKAEEVAAVAAAAAAAAKVAGVSGGGYTSVAGDVGGMPPRMSMSPRSRGEGVEERASVVILTRDRSRTLNLLQTLEPLATKARRALGLPSMVVENRDEATLEAIAKALPGIPSSSVRRTPTRVSSQPVTTKSPSSPVKPPKVGLFGLFGKLADEIAVVAGKDGAGGGGGEDLASETDPNQGAGIYEATDQGEPAGRALAAGDDGSAPPAGQGGGPADSDTAAAAAGGGPAPPLGQGGDSVRCQPPEECVAPPSSWKTGDDNSSEVPSSFSPPATGGWSSLSPAETAWAMLSGGRGESVRDSGGGGGG
ncbi:unnamed protein product, partial [Laminaria digitata]